MTPKKIVSLSFLIGGLLLLSQVIFPIASYKFWESVREDNVLVSPSSNSETLGISVQTQGNFPAFVSDIKRKTNPPFADFLLTIPKIGIKEAKVLVDSNDLDKGPVLLSGTALPGERGNVFISSHSSVLFSNNFSRLINLKTGDQIKVVVLGSEFSYQVISERVVNPADTSVIEPPEPLGRYLSLMTCVPPGLNIKRLVVLAKLI